jgi:hypothetical protein
VYAIWVSQLGAARTDIDPDFFGDARVTTYWDADGVAGEALRDAIGYPGPVVWDVYALFGPGSQWNERPGGLVDSGWPVIADSERLKRELAGL